MAFQLFDSCEGGKKLLTREAYQERVIRSFPSVDKVEFEFTTMRNITMTCSVKKSITLEAAISQLKLDAAGLIPCIAQQYDSKEVLMMAWMSKESLEKTLSTGLVCYWSRSRQALWFKGEKSGQSQKLVELRIDCDNDTLLVLVDQTGPACHTGRRSCFYQTVQGDKVNITSEPLIDPSILYKK